MRKINITDKIHGEINSNKITLNYQKIATIKINLVIIIIIKIRIKTPKNLSPTITPRLTKTRGLPTVLKSPLKNYNPSNIIKLIRINPILNPKNKSLTKKHRAISFNL